MNKKIAAAVFGGVVLTTLTFTVVLKSKEQSVTANPNTENRIIATGEKGSDTSKQDGKTDDPHSGHKMSPMVETSNLQAKLTTPSQPIAPNQPTTLAIAIQDTEGKAVNQFDTFQEKLMHLIVVSDDLQFFSHLHPTLKGNGEFEVSANFPAAGSYSIFSDYKPTGKPEQVSVLKTNVAGTAPVAIAPDFGRSKTIDSTKVDFSVPEVRAEQEVTVTFDLKDINSNRAIQDLQPYLGERGHLVTLKQSSPLTRADYIHAHAMKDTPDGKISFMTTFPQAGKYKLWGQFNRAGKIVVADFWVNVQSAKAASSLSTPHQH